MGGEDQPLAADGKRDRPRAGGDAGADTLREQPGRLMARPVKPAALLAEFAEHPESPSAVASGLLPAAKPAPAFPPEDGNQLLSTEPAVPQRLGQPKPWGGSALSHLAPSRPPLLTTSWLTSSSLQLVLGLRKMRNWWCWSKIGHLDSLAGRAGC